MASVAGLQQTDCLCTTALQSSSLLQDFLELATLLLGNSVVSSTNKLASNKDTGDRTATSELVQVVLNVVAVLPLIQLQDNILRHALTLLCCGISRGRGHKSKHSRNLILENRTSTTVKFPPKSCCKAALAFLQKGQYLQKQQVTSSVQSQPL